MSEGFFCQLLLGKSWVEFLLDFWLKYCRRPSIIAIAAKVLYICSFAFFFGPPTTPSLPPPRAPLFGESLFRGNWTFSVHVCCSGVCSMSNANDLHRVKQAAKATEAKNRENCTPSQSRSRENRQIHVHSVWGERASERARALVSKQKIFPLFAQGQKRSISQ